MNTLKTNSKEVRAEVRKHILDSVYDFEGQAFETFEDAKNHINNEFNRVANYARNIKVFPNNQDRFSDYLNGAPFNFCIYYSEINEFLDSLGINPENKEFSNNLILKKYHYLIYKEITSIFK